MVTHYAITVHIISSTTITSYIIEQAKVRKHPYLENNKRFIKKWKDLLSFFPLGLLSTIFDLNLNSMKHWMHFSFTAIMTGYAFVILQTVSATSHK